MLLYQPLYRMHTIPTVFFFFFLLRPDDCYLSGCVLHICTSVWPTYTCSGASLVGFTAGTPFTHQHSLGKKPVSFQAVEVKLNHSCVALESSRLGAKHIRTFCTPTQSTLGVGNLLFVVEGRHG